METENWGNDSGRYMGNAKVKWNPEAQEWGGLSRVAN